MPDLSMNLCRGVPLFQKHHTLVPTFDVSFRATGATINQNRNGLASLNFLRTGGGYNYVVPTVTTDNLLQAQDGDVGCYDPSGGLWLRRPLDGLITYNQGSSLWNVAYWTATNISMASGVGDGVRIYGGAANSARLTSTDADGTLLRTSEALVSGTRYVVGFPVVTIDDETDPITLVVPTVVQAAECCAGRVRSRLLGTLIEGGHTYRYWDVWDTAVATASATAQVGWKMPQSGKVIYTSCFSLYAGRSATEGWYGWPGPTPAGATVKTTNRETLQVLHPTPTEILPLGSNGEWAMAIEVAWPFDGPNDWTTYFTSLLDTYFHLISWAKCDGTAVGNHGWFGGRPMTLTNYSHMGWKHRTDAVDQQSVCAYIDRLPSFGPMVSSWWGLTGKAGTYAKAWMGKASLAELFAGEPQTMGTGQIQPSGCSQFTDRIMIGGRNDGGYALCGVILRIILWDRRRA